MALNLTTFQKPSFMRKFFVLSILLTNSLFCFSQFSLGVFAGLSNYQGDLTEGVYRQGKMAFGVSGNFEITERLTLRPGITFGKVAGSDAKTNSEFLHQIRNLSFESSIREFSLLGEFSIFNLYNIRWSPYLFAGLAVYHFDPYTYDTTGNKVFLKPLSTEGQGLSAYPDSKPYSLTQLSIPFGGGLKYSISDNVRIGLEVGLRKLFTDYLDDVSTTYADPADLLAEKGEQAVDLSYRGDEVTGEYTDYPDAGYPTKGAQRGSAKYKDYYYFTGLHVTFRLGGGGSSRMSSGKAGKKGYGCPGNPM
jgi:hypothetical protein